MRISLYAILVFSAFKLQAQTTNYQAYALFVVNFAKYSSWPHPKGQMDIKIYGKSKVYDELLKQNGKTINGSVLKVTQIDNLTEIGSPHILYIADGKSSTIGDVLQAITDKSVLVIGEREGLYKKGAGFSFVVMENNTLRYDINNAELEKRQIKVSKALRSLAHTTF